MQATGAIHHVGLLTVHNTFDQILPSGSELKLSWGGAMQHVTDTHWHGESIDFHGVIYIPANMRRWPSVDFLLAQRLRRPTVN